GRIERGLGHPDGERADARPEEVERVHGHREAAVDVPEYLPSVDAHAVEVEAADRMRGEQVEMPAGKPLALPRDRERGDPLRAAVRGSGEDSEHHCRGSVR